MGRESRSVAEVKVTMSQHNDERDKRDEKLADELRAAIEAVAAEPRFEPIDPMVF